MPTTTPDWSALASQNERLVASHELAGYPAETAVASPYPHGTCPPGAPRLRRADGPALSTACDLPAAS